MVTARPKAVFAPPALFPPARPPSPSISKRSGFFSELNVRTVITVPADLTLTLEGDEELTRVVLPSEGPTPILELSKETAILQR